MTLNTKSGIILAAGFGKRMRHLTDKIPKPLICFKGKPLIKYSIEFLEILDFQEIVINVHYKSDQIMEFIKTLNNPKIKISDESSEILDTGGGIKQALSLINKNESLILNSDVLWDHNQTDCIKQMDVIFNHNNCDSLLCLSSLENTIGYKGRGDFMFLDDNKICRYNNDGNKDPFVYGGAQIISKYAFKNFNEDIFSINKIWNRSISNDRLMGYKNDSKIFHMGSIETFNIFNEK